MAGLLVDVIEVAVEVHLSRKCRCCCMYRARAAARRHSDEPLASGFLPSLEHAVQLLDAVGEEP